jgi:hypothetical protein
MNLSQIMQYVGIAVVTLLCVWAWFRGGPAERIGAVVLFFGWICSILFHEIRQGGPGPIVVAIDIAMAVAFSALLIRYRKIWLVLIVACQINLVAAHFVAIPQFIDGWSFFLVINIWGGYGLLFSLALGMILHELGFGRRSKVTATG